MLFLSPPPFSSISSPSFPLPFSFPLFPPSWFSLNPFLPLPPNYSVSFSSSFSPFSPPVSFSSSSHHHLLFLHPPSSTSFVSSSLQLPHTNSHVFLAAPVMCAFRTAVALSCMYGSLPYLPIPVAVRGESRAPETGTKTGKMLGKQEKKN